MLFYPYGIILQAIALIHFVRRRPDNFWIFVILMGGSIGAFVYVLVQIVPDFGLLRDSFQVFPRRNRIKALEGLLVDNPSIGNYEELGDLLLQVVFHCQLSREKGGFDFDDVVQTLNRKLIRRHPHVFSKGIARDTKSVLKQWHEIKTREKRDKRHARNQKRPRAH